MAESLINKSDSKRNLIVMETLRWDSLPLWAGHTQGVFIKGLHVGIKLIVWLCSASKEAFLNLPHKKLHAYHSAAANRNKESTITRLCTFQTSLFTGLSTCLPAHIFSLTHIIFSIQTSHFLFPKMYNTQSTLKKSKYLHATNTNNKIK